MNCVEKAAEESAEEAAGESSEEAVERTLNKLIYISIIINKYLIIVFILFTLSLYSIII